MRPAFVPGDRSRIEEAKSRVGIAAAWLAIGCSGTPPKDGGNSLSPFRTGDNKTAFGIAPCGRLWSDRVTGHGGDVVTFIEEATNCTRSEAIRTLYRLAGMDEDGVRPVQNWPVARPPVETVNRSVPPMKRKPLPPLRTPEPHELSGYARLRGLGPSWVGLEIMSRRGLLFAASRDEDESGIPCFVATDPARRCAMVRRMDGAAWARWCDESASWIPLTGGKSKTWAGAEGGSRWPVGAALLSGELSGARTVILCEGFPDLCAVHTLAWDFFSEMPARLRTVAGVAMVSASVAIADDALPLFAGRRVIIVPHVDMKEDGTNPGLAAAKRWAAQLHAAGASVTFFHLRSQGADFLRSGGKDLCDATAAAIFSTRRATDLSRALFGPSPAFSESFSADLPE